MRQKTYDFLVKMRVPVLTIGGDLLGEGIEIIMRELAVHSFISLYDVEDELAQRTHSTQKAVDQKLRRALDITEFRSGSYPNPELEKLKEEFQFEVVGPKKFMYSVARRLMEYE